MAVQRSSEGRSRADGLLAQAAPTGDVWLIEDLDQQHLQARMVAAALRRAGLRARLLPMGQATPLDHIVALAARAQPRLIVLSILFAEGLERHPRLVSQLRQAGVAAHVTFLGALPSLDARTFLDRCPGLDSVVCGQGETAVVQLASALQRGEPWQPVPGLCHRSPVPSPPSSRERLLPPDELPFPARDGGLQQFQGYGFATVVSSRGCAHACAFCLPRAQVEQYGGAPYRQRSVAHLVDELEALYQRGARLFLFDDEQFLPAGSQRARKVDDLGGELARRGMRIAFSCKVRPDDAEEALFRRLQEIGLLRVYVGIESGCQESLDLLGKGVTVAQNVAALALFDALDLVADFRSLLFHPWTTIGNLAHELAFLRTVLPRLRMPISPHEVEIYPGTRLGERLRQEGRAPGATWPWPYTILEPRAELARRLCRFVFDASGVYGGLQDRLSQAWFALLLQRRFQPEAYDAREASALKASVGRLNTEAVALLAEIAEYAAQGEPPAVEHTNESASHWVGRLHTACAAVEADGIQGGRGPWPS